MRRRVLITGTGAVSALGIGADTLHERWARGESGIVDGWGQCSDFDAAATLSTKEIRRSDRFSQLALAAVIEAVRQAGWEEELPCDPFQIASIVASGIGGLETLEKQLEVQRVKGDELVSGLTVPMMMANAASASIAMRYGFHGEVHCVMSACASGAQAIGTGARLIQTGEADAAVVGGTESAISPFARAAFLNSGALSATGRSIPFDERRDGFVHGEGAGILVLEAEKLVERRGATPLGELLGYGSTSDAYHITAPEPDGRSGAQAVQRALASAGIEPAQVSYINAHGTATPLNDRSEALALKLSMGEALAQIPISSTKSVIGHLMGAAGAVEAVATLTALRRREAPPTVGLEQPDPELAGLDLVRGSARHLDNGNGRPLTGISTSFGFGGHNAVLVLESA